MREDGTSRMNAPIAGSLSAEGQDIPDMLKLKRSKTRRSIARIQCSLPQRYITNCGYITCVSTMLTLTNITALGAPWRHRLAKGPSL
jgi:hypothetical protein